MALIREWRLALSHMVKRHWVGELPLWLSFWGIGLICVGTYFGLLEIVATYVWGTYDPYVWLFSLLFLLVARVFIYGWWIVGSYRAANRGGSDRAWFSKISAFVAKSFLVLTAGLLGYEEIVEMRPLYADAVANVREDPEFGARGVRLSPDGAELEIYGPLTRSLVPALRSLVRDNPSIKLLRLDSGGGRAGAAIALHDIVESHQLMTIVDNQCISACVIVLLAGRERLKTVNAKIGFHAYQIAGNRAPGADDVGAAFMRLSAIPDEFIEQALDVVPPGVWFPTNAQLLENRVVTKIVD